MEGEDWRSRIPPGFKFIPRDDELLLFYLVPKLMGQPLPCGIVTEAEVYKHHAQELLGTNHDAYFFTSRNRKYPNGKRPDRKAGDGFWKASSTIKDIKASDNSVIGQKRTLVYYTNEGTPKGRKTDWLMIEYTIPCSQLSLQDEKLDTWVICKVYLNNREKNISDGAISEDQAIGSSSYYVVHEDTKGPIQIDSLQVEGEDWKLRIPPGFRFEPTDDELLRFYLVPKLTGQSLPCGIVSEDEVYKHHPQELLGTDHEAYFFTSRNRKYPNGKRPDRKASSGFWKATTGNKEINASDNLVIGHKRALVYFIDDGTPKGKKTNWLMVEYTIPNSQLPLLDKQLDTWVICKIYLNNREKNTNCGGAIYEDQAIGSSTRSIINEDMKGPTEVDILQQDTINSKRVRVMLDYSNHNEAQASMQSNPLCANGDMSPCIEMLGYVPPQSMACMVGCSPSRLGQDPSDSWPPVALSPLPPAFTGCAEVGPSTSYASPEVSALALPLGFSNILPRLFDSNLPDILEILEGIEADPYIKYFYSVEAKLKEVLGDSWLEEI